MNRIKRIWFLYGRLSSIERILVNIKTKGGKEKGEALILELVGKKDQEGIASNLEKFLKSLFYSWGIPIIIGFFAWGSLGIIGKNSDISSENLLLGFIFWSIIAYFSGLIFRNFLMKTKVSCPKCHSTLICEKCNKQVYEVDGE